MSSPPLPPIMPVQVDDFADRVLCFQNLYKDLISAHPCAHVFEQQLNIVGAAISDLAEQSRLAALYGKASPTGRKSLLDVAHRVADSSSNA